MHQRSCGRQRRRLGRPKRVIGQFWRGPPVHFAWSGSSAEGRVTLPWQASMTAP
jgi:hypothetical protein